MNGLPSAIVMLLTSICLASCTPERAGQIVTPKGVLSGHEWTAEERQKEVAVRTLRKTSGASHHLIRLRTAEKPHVHDHHDLTVFVLAGKGRMHLAGRSTVVHPGDVIEIPRGTVHWAENLDTAASEVYAVFNPPFDGKDRRFVNAER